MAIAFEAVTQRAAEKQNHAIWSAKQQVGGMPYNPAVSLGLENRVIEGLVGKCTDVQPLHF